MPKGAAARLADPVSHTVPPMLGGGTGSPNVLIGGKPAWRGVPAGVAAGITAAKQAAEKTLATAKAATAAASGTPGYGAAKAAEESTKASSAASMTALIQSSAGGADLHACSMPPIPPPIHGPGLVIDGSATVLINGLPACRMGDSITEAFGSGNRIVMGLPTVVIGP